MSIPALSTRSAAKLSKQNELMAKREEARKKGKKGKEKKRKKKKKKEKEKKRRTLEEMRRVRSREGEEGREHGAEVLAAFIIHHSFRLVKQRT